MPARFCLMLLVGHWDSLSPLGHLENELGIVGSDCGVCVLSHPVVSESLWSHGLSGGQGPF